MEIDPAYINGTEMVMTKEQYGVKFPQAKKELVKIFKREIGVLIAK